MKKSPRVSGAPLHIRAYFDFMCPWSYLGKARLQRALQRAKVDARVDWIPFELYTPDKDHHVAKEKILGHEHLSATYAQLHEMGARENLVILHPQYEASSRRALTGYLYAEHRGLGEKYLDAVYEHVFGHAANIASPAVLERIAIRLGMDPAAFLSFVQNPHNQARVASLSQRARDEGVRGIPTYQINHLPVTGALPVEDLVHILHSASQHVLPAYVVEKVSTKKVHASHAPKKKHSPASRKTKKPGKSRSPSAKKKHGSSRKR